MEGYEQLFDLTYRNGSYCAYSMKVSNKQFAERMTVFNSTTFASE